MLRVHELGVSYPTRTGELQVLDNVSLEVNDGEFLAVVGPSGCGKTTLLHVLNALLPPTSGRVDRAGATTAMVFQRPTLMPWRTVLANATFGLECKGVARDEAERRALVLLERMQLADHVADFPHQLSEGMKQRVNLARALLVEPDVLLLDEPFSALDVMTRRQLQDDLLELWQRHSVTVVLVSHSLEEVAYLADRVGVMGTKPTGLRAVVDIELPRPRAADPEAAVAMMRVVEDLHRRMVG